MRPSALLLSLMGGTQPSQARMVLDTERRLRLLEMTFVRITVAAGYMLLIGIALMGWAALEGFLVVGMVLWTLAFALLWPGVFYALQKFRHNFTQTIELGEPALTDFYRQWFRIILAFSAVLGGLMGILTIVNAGVPSFEYLLILAVVIAIIQATGAAPVLKIYQTYYMLSWGGTLATLPIVFPTQWPYFLVLGLIHAVSIAQHAKRVSRFFYHQVELEQWSTQLAEQARTAEQQAQIALQQKNEFLATASHDLRQPLHALNLNVEALRHLDLGQRPQTLLADVQVCARNLTQMFNSILDLSKLESGGAAIDMRSVDLTRFLADLGRVFAAEAAQRQIDFRLRLPKHPVVIYSDENLLRQIVINLLQNALRYTTHGGVLLALRVCPTPRVEVIDTGIGIAQEDMPRIHQPFFRARGGFSENIDSHGLGLAVVGRCVAMLGAQHGFRSRPGHGSRFWVGFPTGTKTDEPAHTDTPTKEAPAQYAGALAGDRCLILEDDPVVARGWKSFLTPTELDLVVTADKRETNALLGGGFSPDYVLCDLRLRSGDNGYAILKSILAKCPTASGAMVSGEFNAQELLDAAEEGIPVLQKPVSPADLMRLLLLWRSVKGSL